MWELLSSRPVSSTPNRQLTVVSGHFRSFLPPRSTFLSLGYAGTVSVMYLQYILVLPEPHHFLEPDLSNDAAPAPRPLAARTLIYMRLRKLQFLPLPYQYGPVLYSWQQILILVSSSSEVRPFGTRAVGAITSEPEPHCWTTQAKKCDSGSVTNLLLYIYDIYFKHK
jgi:hypothetical protein